MTAKMQVVADNFEAERQAAIAGDQAKFDALGEETQSKAVPAIGKAMQPIGVACGIDQSDQG